MFAHLKSSKSINTCLLAPISLLLFAHASSAQSKVDGNLIAQSKYVQTYSFGKKTSAVKEVSKPKKKSTSSKASKTKSTSKTASKAASKKKVEMIVGPKQYTSSGGAKWEKFSDFINLKPGQEKLPLKFTVLNGSGGTPPLRAIRATLSGRMLFTEKDFKGKRKLSIDLSKALTPGATQIIFTSYGAAGSAFKWQISSSSMPQIISLAPAKAEKDKPLTVKGKNLPPESSAITVTVEKRAAKVTDAKVDSFKFKIPEKVKPGKDKVVSISISGKKIKDFKIQIQAIPEITELSHIAIAGGQMLTITGKNFTDKVKDVEVTFNGEKGLVSSASEKRIFVQTPDFQNIPAPVTIQVKIGGLNCKQAGKLLGNMRNIQNPGYYSPFQVARHLF